MAKNYKRIGIIIVLGVLVVPVAIIALIVALFVWGSKQISITEANVICHKVATDASDKLAAVPGYSITNSSERCVTQTDEMGGSDYKGGGSFLVTKQPADGSLKAEMTSADTEALRKQLPIVQEAWSIRNIIDADGKSSTLCASTYAYIDNDGKFISQGNTSNHASFFTAKNQPGYSDECL